MYKRRQIVTENLKVRSHEELVALLAAEPSVPLDQFGRNGMYDTAHLWDEIRRGESKLLRVLEIDDEEGTVRRRVGAMRLSCRAIITAGCRIDGIIESDQYGLYEIARWKLMEGRHFLIFPRYYVIEQEFDYAVSGTRIQGSETSVDAIIREVEEELGIKIPHEALQSFNGERFEGFRESRYYPGILSIVFSQRFGISLPERPMTVDPIIIDGDKLIFLRWRWIGFGQEPRANKAWRTLLSFLYRLMVLSKRIFFHCGAYRAIARSFDLVQKPKWP